MYFLSYYVPESAHERVKQVLFDKGAGKTDCYEQCCWEVKGQGQFSAMLGSHPAIGQVGELKQLLEYKVEMVCADENIKEVIQTLLAEHPYEQPAYFFYPVLTLEGL
ncbi:MAG: NGG1p interacting factor NIF3 [gamma proteobacterium symbiont of Taylorina sp.]|nr:NGG1p interacting factor NIF3 [gamma proteobacterium symbiont of Taylorina sp.]